MLPKAQEAYKHAVNMDLENISPLIGLIRV
jgi:hypothetical protein